MKSQKDIAEMTKDEFDEYFKDVLSGYEFDPDDEILNADKLLSAKELFVLLNKEADNLQFRPINDLMMLLSRTNRIARWICEQEQRLLDKIGVIFNKKTGESK